MKAIRLFFERLFSYLPSRLPIGMTDFEAWAESVIRIAGVPDNRSTRQALAIMIMHAPAEVSRKGKWYWAMKLYKGCAQEVAYAVFNEAQQAKKAEQQALADQEAAEQKKLLEVKDPEATKQNPVEATTETPVVADEKAPEETHS